MTALGIHNLHKRFGDVDVLRDFDLRIGDGEFVSLLGPSGCGKTTTLRCVAGFEFPDEGQILFGDRDLTDTAPEHRDVGMVFQSYALFPHLTVRENLAFGLDMRKTPSGESKQRIDTVLEMVQLTGLDARYPRELSGGQQQRVALARALVIEPSVLLLDEPLANLDAALRDDMRFFIRDLQQRVGITSVYVTHDQSEAIVMSDRIVVMFDGRIAQVGTPREIHGRPATRQVAEFIGRSNFLSATVEDREDSGSYRVKTAAGAMIVDGPENLQTGDTADLLIRPECLRLGDGDAGWNRINARVEKLVYLGDAITLKLAATDGTEMTAETRADSRVASGETITVSFPPDNGWLLP